jgi:nucleoside-diphosphate-sugar epimerase
VLRLKDGGPILVPETPDLPLRHIYAGDVVNAVVNLVESGAGKGDAINVSQDETVSLHEFLALLSKVMGLGDPRIVTMKQSELEAAGFLPDCSPFSDRWMSELDNTRSKEVYGMSYTPLETYLSNITRYYAENPPANPSTYKRRHAEVQYAMQKT